MDCEGWTADYGLRTGYKHGLGYKTRTKHNGLGIKYGLRYKTRTEHYGLGMKHLGEQNCHPCVMSFFPIYQLFVPHFAMAVFNMCVS